MEVPRVAVLIIFLFALLLPALDGPVPDPGKKPVCDSTTKGLYWPEAANHDRRALRRYAREGVLERCVTGPWRHRWQAMTVSAKAAAAKADTRNEQIKK